MAATVAASTGAVEDASETAQLALLFSALESVGHSSDWYHWARSEGLYFNRDALVSRLRSGDGLDDRSAGRIIVLDVRDEDVAGGMVRGAIHCPDGRFGAECILELLRRAAREEEEEEKTTLLLHCMESARRAPRCARRLIAAVDALRESGHPVQPLDVKILEGGFDQFCRRHWDDPVLVQGYDDEYWGYESMGGSQLVLGEGGEVRGSDKAPSHVTYVRPADQAATPWSGPGTVPMG